MKPFAIALLAAALMAGAQNREEADRLLKAAQNTELVDGNLNAAIKRYGEIVAKYARTDRAVAAAALIRMADCYRKMGDAESRKVYERVLRDYADQKDAAATARARLGGAENGGRMTSTLAWSGPDADDEGTVSPDGRYLSYPDWNSGDLAVRELATGRNRRITDTKQTGGHLTRFAEESAISRDGKLVAYSWFDEDNGSRYELRVASLVGDPNPHRLYDKPDVDWLAPLDWSPDGKWVAAVIARNDGANQIGLISVPDGSLRVLTSGHWRSDRRAFFSPDGKYVGFDLPLVVTGAERGVFVMATDGTGETAIAPHRGRSRMMGWSPDGTRLLFASDRGGTMALWSVAIKAGKQEGEPELLKADLGDAWPMGVTRGGALYYGITSGMAKSSVQVGVFDFTTGTLSSPRDVTQDYQEFNSNPIWSRDGKYLAYLSRREGNPYSPTRIVIRSADDLQVVRELQPKFLRIGLNDWSADGRSLLVTGRDGGHVGVFSVDFHTGEVSFVAPDSPEHRLGGAIWSADKKSLYLKRTASDGKEVAFVRRDPATGVETDIIRRLYLGGLSTAGVSPDGRYLFTASVDPSTNSRLMLLIPLDGGEPRVAISVSAETRPEDLKDYTKGQVVTGMYWMPDGRSFLVSKGPGGQKEREVWQVPVDGSAPHKLPWQFTPKFIWGMPRPRTQQIASTIWEPKADRSTEIWVLDHFLPGPAAK